MRLHGVLLRGTRGSNRYIHPALSARASDMVDCRPHAALLIDLPLLQAHRLLTSQSCAHGCMQRSSMSCSIYCWTHNTPREL